MSPSESLLAFSRRVEQTTARFSAALSRIAAHLPVLSQKLKISIDEDLDTCVILRFIDSGGHEAALSIEPDFGSSQVVVMLLLEDDADGDLKGREIRCPDPVAEGMLQIMAHFSQREGNPVDGTLAVPPGN